MEAPVSSSAKTDRSADKEKKSCMITLCAVGEEKQVDELLDLISLPYIRSIVSSIIQPNFGSDVMEEKGISQGYVGTRLLPRKPKELFKVNTTIPSICSAHSTSNI